jgi:hypothetical protein
VRGLGVAAGALALVMCGLVRDRGRRLEPGLWASWGGSPTVRRLRWRDADDPEPVSRLHARLNPILDESLPDAQTESRNNDAADRRYDEAVAVLRERTRDAVRFRLLFAENMEYGFRRNSLGLRPFALAIAAIALVLAVALFVWGGGNATSRLIRWGISAGISAALFSYWWRIVTPDWVRLAAELYADRLIEAIDTLRAEARG